MDEEFFSQCTKTLEERSNINNLYYLSKIIKLFLNLAKGGLLQVFSSLLFILNI